MKQLLSWRQLTLYVLFAVGFLAVVLVFAEDERPLDEWIAVRIGLVIISTACFYPMAKLTRKWEHEGKIPRCINEGDTEI